MFEVETLKYATLATVSRCGMVWFSEEVISPKMIFNNYLERLKQEDYDKLPKLNENEGEENTEKSSPESILRERCVQAIDFLFKGEPSFVEEALRLANTIQHVMEFTVIRVVEAMMALIRKGISNVL